MFGALGHDVRFELPERHLGLVQDETDDIDRRLDALADAIESAVDLAAVRRARRLRSRPAVCRGGRPASASRWRAIGRSPSCIPICWRAGGWPAEILPFSPLADEAPDQGADVVWLPGGYPELHGGVLAAARRFQDGLHLLAARSVPIHGECGGYMVLGQGIEDAEGRRHSMAGLLQVETSFAKRRLHIGYRRAASRRQPVGIGRRGDHGT